MNRSFEDHCWREVVPPDALEVYSWYAREVCVGPRPALLAIDLYDQVYRGGARPVAEIAREHPGTCGEYAWAAVAPTQRLLAAARKAGLPVFYTTNETRPDSRSQLAVTRRPRAAPPDPDLYSIRPEFAPQPGDVVIRKQRASAFFGTPLIAHLTQLGVRTVIVCGESTSGCVRASVLDAHSNGFHVVVVEECCFDRFLLTHQINLFDMHHKYADVMHVDEVVAHLDSPEFTRESGF